MKFFYKRFFYFFFILFLIPISGQTIDISSKKEVNILKYSDLYFDTQKLTLKEIRAQKLFRPYREEYINTGMQKLDIWVRFTLHNSTNRDINRVLVVTSPILESIVLYSEENLTHPHYKGVRNITKKHHTLFPYYRISMQAHTTKTYYLKANSQFTPVDFGLKLVDFNNFEYRDRVEQLVDTLLIGFVVALMLYSFILHFYTKDKSYLYYSFYLFALVYQQMTYLGLTQIYFPLRFINIDMQIPIVKVNLLVITAALFAMHFLKTKLLGVVDKIYKLFIVVSLLEIVILNNPYLYNLEIVIITGTLFILFNLYAGIVSYFKGNKQARLFIVGFGIVFLSYLMIILDALGVTTIIQKYPNILMFATAFEALILSLAFADRYLILQKEKASVDAQIIQESKIRANIIEQEVIKKTKELHSALETKELLLKEVHHRVKNNLQIILSIIKLQQDEIDDATVEEKFIDLENRINAISKTYNMLLIEDNIENIDMQEYIEALLLDIRESLQKKNQKVAIKRDINAKLPLRESVYLGLVINELVTNAYKYAFDTNNGIISISLQQHGKSYTLEIKDNGKGYNSKEIGESLGLRLIETLIFDQLNGTLEKDTKNHTYYTIRFSI